MSLVGLLGRAARALGRNRETGRVLPALPLTSWGTWAGPRPLVGFLIGNRRGWAAWSRGALDDLSSQHGDMSPAGTRESWGYQTGVHKSHLFHRKSGEREEGLGISNQSAINNSTAVPGASSVRSPFKIPGLGVCLGSSSGDCAFCFPPLPRPPLPSSALTAL